MASPTLPFLRSSSKPTPTEKVIVDLSDDDDNQPFRSSSKPTPTEEVIVDLCDDDDDQPLRSSSKPTPAERVVVVLSDDDDDQPILISSDDEDQVIQISSNHENHDADGYNGNSKNADIDGATSGNESITSLDDSSGDNDGANEETNSRDHVDEDEDRASDGVAGKRKRPTVYRKWNPKDDLTLVRTDGKLLKENPEGGSVAAAVLLEELLKLDSLSRKDLDAQTVRQHRYNLQTKFRKMAANSGNHNRAFDGTRKSKEDVFYECCAESWPDIEHEAIADIAGENLDN